MRAARASRLIQLRQPQWSREQIANGARAAACHLPRTRRAFAVERRLAARGDPRPRRRAPADARRGGAHTTAVAVRPLGRRVLPRCRRTRACERASAPTSRRCHRSTKRPATRNRVPLGLGALRRARCAKPRCRCSRSAVWKPTTSIAARMSGAQGIAAVRAFCRMPRADKPSPAQSLRRAWRVRDSARAMRQREQPAHPGVPLFSITSSAIASRCSRDSLRVEHRVGKRRSDSRRGQAGARAARRAAHRPPARGRPSRSARSRPTAE